MKRRNFIPGITTIAAGIKPAAHPQAIKITAIEWSDGYLNLDPLLEDGGWVRVSGYHRLPKDRAREVWALEPYIPGAK